MSGKHASGQDPLDPNTMRDESGDGWSAGNQDDSRRGRGNEEGQGGDRSQRD